MRTCVACKHSELLSPCEVNVNEDLRRARLAKLRAVGDPISFRKEEVGRRAALAAKADKFVGLATGALGDWPKSKPWLNETDTAEFGKQVRRLPEFACSVFGVVDTHTLATVK